MKSGFVSIVGRPNVGKSTLLNSLLERKIAITSNVSGTTRNIIQGIYNDDDSQIVFIDTPGIHKPQNKLGTYLNQKAYMMTEDVDLLLFLVDVEKGFGKGDQFILEKIKQENKPTFLILNKVDRIKKETLFEIITELNKLHDFKEIIPVSALKGDNVVDLINTIKKYLNDDVKYYDDEVITNVSRNFLIAEFVREKILHLTNKEVPHTVNCMVESYEDTGNIIEISVLIIVDRDNLKKIIIGKQGRMLKEIGIQARQDIEEMLGSKVNLQLWVKVKEDWRDNSNRLNQIFRG
jgi:GTP-binding protein Era